MKKLWSIGIALLLSIPISAAEGEIGYFGGISPGIPMVTSTQSLQAKSTSLSKYTLPYKENIYLSGKAEEVTGTIEIRPGKIDKTKGTGKTADTYVIKAQNEDATCKVSRNITLQVQFAYDEKLHQMTKTATVSKWTESITSDGKNYVLNSKASSLSKSVLEDYTPGVTYYRGDISYDAVYTSGEEHVSVSVTGPIYGYDHAFGKAETQKRSIVVDRGNEQFYIEETPNMSSYKDLQYNSNEPVAISFSGNYKEVIQGQGGLSYRMAVGAEGAKISDLMGSTSVSSNPIIDQLAIPSLPGIRGHAAESDIKKMYSLKIFTEPTVSFSSSKMVTKKEYVEMLVKALKIPVQIEETSSKKSRRGQKEEEVSPFTDLKADSSDYPYAKAAYDAGLISGGAYNGNRILTRQELYVLNMRAVGLERLGMAVGQYTPLTDNNRIAAWAKSSIYAAIKIGLIEDASGYIFPQKQVNKAECAMFINQLLDYLRYDLQKAYLEQLL